MLSLCKVDNEDTQVSVWLFGGNDNLVRLLKLCRSSIVVFTDGPLKDSLCAQPLVINIPLGENAFTRVDTNTLAVRIGTDSMLTFQLTF